MYRLGTAPTEKQLDNVHNRIIYIYIEPFILPLLLPVQGPEKVSGGLTTASVLMTTSKYSCVA